MDFFDRAKDKLLKQNQNEISKLEKKINKLNQELSGKNEIVKDLTQKKDNEIQNKSEFEKTVLKENEMEDLKVLYEFIANYPKINKIVDKVSQMTPLYEDEVYDIYDGIPDEIFNYEEMNRRRQFYEKLKALNDEIIEICNKDVQELNDQEEIKEEKKQEEQIPEKKGFFAKLFGRDNKTKNQADSNVQKKEQKHTMFLYKATIERFKRYFDSFLIIDPERNDVMDRNYCTKVYSNIKYLLGLKRRGIQLEQDDEQYLRSMEPFELLEEVLRYYSNMEIIRSIINSFDSRFKKYELLYKTNPELFDINTLKTILEENNLTIIDLKSRRKNVTNINSELTKKRENAKETKNQIIELERKKKELIEKKKKIENEKNIKELGYKDKEDAARRLEIDLKEFILIPISKDISNITELFNDEKQLRIEADGKTFNTAYSNNVAYGRINSLEENENVDLVLLIPIANLNKEDIDNIKSGNIGLYSSVMKTQSIVAIKSSTRKFDFEGNSVEVLKENDIFKATKKFLGEDFISDYDKEISNYDIFKNIPNISAKEKKLKRDSVKKGLIENISKNISEKEKVLVDGKVFYLNNNDTKDMQYLNKNEALNEEKIKTISDRIEDYLIEGSHSSIRIDGFYNDLLYEYMRINKKARAEYIYEDNTIINIKDKEYSIKPMLPPKEDDVSRKYTRKNEDKAYKMIKLANLVNRFAHLTENEELQNKLFQIKLDLIEEVIDLSKNNPNIKVKQQFDETKMVRSVIVEIPGYNMIALHIMNTNGILMKKANSLEYSNDEVVQTSTIQYPGVNKELLLTLKKMNNDERVKLLLDLEPNTFYKLMIRMGYNSEIINSVEERKEFVEKVISDEKIDELIKESNEIERE